MSKLEILKLLRELVQDSYLAIYSSDDPSGAFTQTVVGQEELLMNIDKEIQEIAKKDIEDMSGLPESEVM